MEYEFLEAHAVVGHGQDWPVEQISRDALIKAHIKQTEQEIENAKK